MRFLIDLWARDRLLENNIFSGKYIPIKFTFHGAHIKKSMPSQRVTVWRGRGSHRMGYSKANCVCPLNQMVLHHYRECRAEILKKCYADFNKPIH